MGLPEGSLGTRSPDHAHFSIGHRSLYLLRMDSGDHPDDHLHFAGSLHPPAHSFQPEIGQPKNRESAFGQSCFQEDIPPGAVFSFFLYSVPFLRQNMGWGRIITVGQVLGIIGLVAASGVSLLGIRIAEKK